MKKEHAVIAAIGLALSLGVYVLVVNSPLSKLTEHIASSPSQPTQQDQIETPKVIVQNISEADAKAKAEKAIVNVGLTPGNLVNVNITKDIETKTDIYVLNYVGAEVNLEPITGKVLYLRDKKNHTNIAKKIKTQDQAKAQVEKFYGQFQASEGTSAEYKLAYLDQPTSDDFWTGVFQKEVIPGVFSQYESIKIGFDAEGKLMSYKQFNVSPKSIEVKVTQEQAIDIANASMLNSASSTLPSYSVTEHSAEAPSNPSNVPGYVAKIQTASEAKLQVVKANNMVNELDSSQPDHQEPLVTLAWVVYFPYKGQIKGFRVLYVDANTGEVLGGDQTK